MKRSLRIVLVLVAWLGMSVLPGMRAQQAVTDEVSILQLPVPPNVIGTYVRGASNDGRRLVVESINDYNGNNVDSNTEIWVYDVDSRSFIQVTDTKDIKDPANAAKTLLSVNSYMPMISGDGTKVVFTSNASLGGTTNEDGNYEIYVADLPRGAKAATITRITDTGMDTTDETVKEILSNYSPTISDDGRTLAFLSTRRLFRAVANGPASFSALKEGSNNTEPDGNAEVFVYREATRQFSQVTATRDIDTTVSFAVRGFNSSPYLSGNGSVLLFLSAFNFAGAAAGKNTDFNGELFVHNVGDAVNTVRQVTETSAKSAVPPNGPENVLPPGTHPLNFDGTKLVFESSGDFAAKNSDKTREVYLADLSGAKITYRQITEQATVNILTSDFGFYPSINSPGTQIALTSVLNLTPATTSSVRTDNADGSREVFRFEIASGKYRQLTFTPRSTGVFDQRDARTAPFVNDSGDLISFSFESASLLPAGAVIADVFQAKLRTVISSNTDEVKMANSASYDNTQVARGSMVSLFGTQLSNTTARAASSALPFELNGVSVTVAGISAGLIYVSPTQINMVLPGGIAAGDAVEFTVNNNGVRSSGKVKVVDVAPGVFAVTGTGKGAAAAQCGQFAPDGLTFPLTAPPCSVGNESQFAILVIYLTGIRNTQAVQIKIGDTTLLPSFTGAQPTFPGLDQINVGLARELASKSDLEITVIATTTTSIESNKTTVSFLPIEEPVTTVNGASFEATVVARGSVAIAQGTKLADADATAPGPDFPTTLGGVSVTVADLPAQLISVSEKAVTFIVPDGVKVSDFAEVVVNNKGTRSRGRVKTLVASAGLFTTTKDGNGTASVKCGTPAADGTITYTDPPCAVGTEAAPNRLRLFGTGWRKADKVTVKIGDSELETLFAGPQPGLAGYDIIDVKLVPALAAKADVDILVTTSVANVGKISKSGVKVTFK